MRNMIMNGTGKIEPSYRPIVLVSKEDGQIDSLSHRQDYYTTNRLEKSGLNTATGSPLP